MNNINFLENWFAAVILKNSKMKVVVPLKWIGNLDLLQILNIGVRPTKDHLIFYSKNRNDEPNFAAEVKENFDEDGAFCYDGKVLHIWGKLQRIYCQVKDRNYLFCHIEIISKRIHLFIILFADTYEHATDFLDSHRKTAASNL